MCGLDNQPHSGAEADAVLQEHRRQYTLLQCDVSEPEQVQSTRKVKLAQQCKVREVQRFGQVLRHNAAEQAWRHAGMHCNQPGAPSQQSLTSCPSAAG